MSAGSWIIVNKETRAAIFETFNASTAQKINTDKFEALPAAKYLGELNKRLKNEKF